jgi:hypothetical protein
LHRLSCEDAAFDWLDVPGPEQVMQIVEERAPDGFDVVTDALSQHELEDIAANCKHVAGFQVDGLDAQPPIVQLPKQVLRA